MTQAYNLSQLANNLNTSGQLDATDGLVNAVPIANGGTGASTAAAARTNLDVAQAVFSVPSGGIIMWSGSVANIPTGWFLCNGSNGTPDLRNRFVVGAGSTYNPGATGGSADSVVVSHTHTATSSVSDPGHEHLMAFGEYSSPGNFDYGVNMFINNSYSIEEARGYSSDSSTSTTGITVGTTVSSTGVSGTNANLPPYFALCFIMKS